MVQKQATGKGAIWHNWSARGYLDEYFKEFGTDVKQTTAFVTRELAEFPPESLSRVLDFGSGPTIIGIISAARNAREIHIADYLDENLEEIRKWQRKDPNRFDFDAAISHTLELEGIQPTPAAVAERANLLREKITEILHCDAGSAKPLGSQTLSYPLVVTLYCADSATSSKDEWRKYMKNILGLVAPGGSIILAALAECTGYAIGRHTFPSANIRESDLRAAFTANGFPQESTRIELLEAPDKGAQGFTGLLFARARKNATTTL